MTKHQQQTNPQPLPWQEAISAKKYDLHDEKQHDQPEGDFTQRNMNRSQQSWLKMFIQHVMYEKGQVLFDNLAWFAKKLCSVMTSASACEHMWSIEGWIHNIHIYHLSIYVYVSASSSSFLTCRTAVTCTILYARNTCLPL
jgi:hypothetical protein